MINTTADGGSEGWAVQNLYRTYSNLDYLHGSAPTVQFSLGLDGKTPLPFLKAAVLLSSKSLEQQPEAVSLLWYAVSLKPYLVSGRVNGGSALSNIPLIIERWIGSIVLPLRTAAINITVCDLPAIKEGRSGCAPGAAARSISYLGEVHDFDTDTPQDSYDDLVGQMENGHLW